MSEQPIQLDTLHVHVQEVSLRKLPNGPDRMFVQTDGTGKVLVDFADGANEWGKALELNEEQYEALRQEAFRRELADLKDIPTYTQLYASSKNSGSTTTPNGNTLGRVSGETSASGDAAEYSNPEIESETPAEGITGDEILDGLQLGLDIVGLIPVVGEIGDVANAGISLARGDYAGAALSLLSAVPFAGYLGTAGKIGRHGAKAVAEASVKTSKEVVERTAKEAAQKRAKEAAARRQPSGGKVRPKKLQKKKPECFDPRQSDAYKKMSETEKKGYAKEYARQLKRQEDAINNMSAKEFSGARRMFDETKRKTGDSGRNPLADKAQRDYRRDRRKEIEKSIYESKRNKGVVPKVAKAEAKAASGAIMEKLAALHEPDMIAGGWAKPDPTGLGDKRVNSAIGGSWGHKERIETLERAAERAIERGDGEGMMNVELTICPPDKKRK
ncbi:polymorphic toxin type 15 domain-containing protein [Pseudomonas sp. LB-090624]|uniref:polymorphic toxin type 15 domain-containing protein n=1 Tax=Pseudomonas sp. LB-090624 TaxID=2213079 RepID=UPI0011B47968|nr:polymorphic toxin type 15 domain-containing protein [Pseudomonas sp. LB-090624]